MTNTAIQLSRLSKAYPNSRGIHDLNLNVDQGDIFGLLGPCGAGKTTAMKVISGLIKPDSGDVNFFGSSITDHYVDAIKQVGCMIDTTEPYPYLTANENLQLIARFYPHVDQGRIDECLKITGMIKYKHEKAKKYSLGMKQRLGMATAILSRPKLLILDEPMNGLDFEGKLEIGRLMKRISVEEGTTLFISSHLIHDMEQTCTRIGVLYDGKLVNEDYTGNILSNYSSLEKYFASEVDRHDRV
ncbi:ABC transporter ATP-binding protein [Paenibacillus sp. 481]|uniref:ABC transporter ATP-binding protein n=1 Tax=Paenibacillus sp. 481 TaxID=2835869 RepID=UPI001E30F2D5|nr:ATP-binding cassette domain-containing protein [Paenibacillus sp. 481]UHA75155.1 ATP-binding cassette domain-containing protein [Paenibacillus sp. 481]